MPVTGSSWERYSVNSAMPPSCRNFSSTGVSPRRSRITSSRPGTMNDVWRARPRSPSSSKVASLVKIWRSGQKRTRVPVLVFATRPPLRVRPDFSWNDASGPSPAKTPGTPRRKLMPCWEGVAVDVDVEPGGQRVDHRGADAVQTAGRDVRRAAELAARVQLGEDHLDTGEAGLGLLVDRDAAPVVVHLGGAVAVERDLDQVAGAGQGLVHAVVDDLPQAVHETAGVGGPDVHARALADRLQPLEDEEVCCVVGVVGDRGAPVSCWRSSPWIRPGRALGSVGALSRLPATRRRPVQARCRGGQESGSTVGHITKRTRFGH